MSEQPKNARALNALTYEQRLDHPRRCTARRQRDGKPCGRFAIRGGTVCRIHGGASPQAQRKAKERLNFAKAIMLERAVRGVTPDPSVSPADKRLAKVVAKRAGKPIRRAAKRPAGPPGPIPDAPTNRAPEPERRPVPAPEAAVAQPERPVEPAKPAGAPPWAEPPARTPSGQLVPEEQALAEIAAANRRARVSHRRRQCR
ncbi:hypothetical protein LAUMK4_00289 [Mycobacterium persicum]|uniref:Uncharacterized protein n=1 Tax=Mycobacterium persicum TaxID=1487726 RepID=A0ABY6RBZ7_9MYCO|nr:hypothetical protein LAUMK15_00642 [Mycobacterium persicum]VAZ87181.1 hypothetical protein LAUMK4_00289 [Mycobacterium persicum]